MWRKIITRLPISFPPVVGSVHWMRPNQDPKVGRHSPQYECNISRSLYRFYDREVEKVTDAELLSFYGTTHSLMPQNKDVFASYQFFIDPEGSMQVVYQHALEQGATITEALAAALCLDDGGDPGFDRLFYFCPKENDPNEPT